MQRYGLLHSTFTFYIYDFTFYIPYATTASLLYLFL